MKLAVAAVTATFRRPRELQRLLKSLAENREALATVVVVDNEGSDEVKALVEEHAPIARYVRPGVNLGCGAGLRLAEERALELGGPDLTHLLILDDDAVLPPGTIRALAEAMEQERATLVYPLVTNAEGKVGWLPGFAERSRELNDLYTGTPDDFRTRFGPGARDFVWAQGICLLASRDAIARNGLHRGDFWVRGEDLEFSLRFTTGGRGVLAPGVVVQHLPPVESNSLSREAEYWKHCALIQNMAFVGFRLPHGRRIAWTLPGGLKRFFRLWSWSALGDACRALWRGAVCGEPAGVGSGLTFRGHFDALLSATK